VDFQAIQDLLDQREIQDFLVLRDFQANKVLQVVMVR
jgi:hypothetical protein